MPAQFRTLSLRQLLLLTCVGLAGSGWAFAEAQATEPAKIETRAGVHPTFDRLVFQGTKDLRYELHRDGAQAWITFETPVTLNLQPFSTRRLTRARNFRFEDGEHPVLRFTLAPQAQVKESANNGIIILDVSGPHAPESSPPPTTPTEAKPPQEPAPLPPAQPAPPPPAPSEASKVEAPPPQPAPSSPPATPLALKPAPTASASPPLEISFAPELIATLDPKLEMGAVIYARAGYGMIVFDRKVTVDPATLATGAPPRVKLEPIDLPRNTGFRFAIPPDVELRATRTGTAWQLFLSKQRKDIAVTTHLLAQPDFALGARLFLPTTQAPEPVRYTDPLIGDELLLVPLRETEAFNAPQKMADLMLIPAAQGLVVKPLQEKVAVRPVSDGIEITATGGLLMSSAQDTGANQQSPAKARAAAAGQSLFDFAAWAGKSGEHFTRKRQRLMQTVVDVPEAERNRARLELARFYFAHGMGEETLAMLTFLTKLAPDLAAHPEFLALRGAALLLIGHTQEGLRDLSEPDLAYQPEIQLWQAFGAALQRDWKTAEEKFAITENILLGYPEPFYSRFSVLAIEAAVATDKDREAAEWLDRMETQNHRVKIEPALRYLRGVLHGKAGRAEAAQALWQEVAKSHDRLYKIRAELALVDLGVATHSLTPVQAVERLEGLRYAWRGDDLEVDILRRLGGFYAEAKSFRPALTTSAQATHLYPDSPMTPAIRAEMSKLFRNIFLGDLGKALSPVEALTLYQDFRDLMPVGEDGDTVGRNLAERLVAIDLLDQAANILEDQVKNRLKGETRIRTGTRLAAIRLLDHKADAAFAALDLSQDAAMPEELQNERVLLRARALSEQGKDDEALKLLANTHSAPAKMLRADITMRAQRWDEAAAALIDLIGPPPKAGQTLGEDKAQWLISAAIALALANDTDGVDKLAIDFSAAMAGTTQGDTFRVLTRPDKAGSMRDIGAAQARIAEVDLFRGFLDTYRTGAKPEKK